MIRILVAGLLLWSAQATIPQDLVARAAATCNRDNCYREVFGTTTPGRSASGAAACTSYLQQTVSPCPTTTTSTTTSTTTVATTTSTSTASSTTTSTTTLSFTETSTVTTTVTGVAPGKRDLEVRVITALCSPVTVFASSTGVPKYASDCTGTRFSSVCSCNGNIPTATTLPTPTVTATTTATTSVTASTAIVTTFTATNTVTTSTTTRTTTTSTVYVAPAPTCTAGSFFSTLGNYYQIRCNYNYDGANGILFRFAPLPDIYACIDQCDLAGYPDTQAVDYYNVAIGSADTEAAGNCYCLGDTTKGSGLYTGITAAYKVVL